MKKIFIFLILILPEFSFSQTVVIPNHHVSDEQVQEFLRKNPNQISIQDFWVKNEKDSTTGLDRLINDIELGLQSKITWPELEKSIGIAKKVAFGSAHRTLLIDYLEKQSQQAQPESLKKMICFESKLDSIERVSNCSKDEILMKNLKINENEFPIVIIDGVEMSTINFKHLRIPNFIIRAVFISSAWLPFEFVGTPKELLQKNAEQKSMIDPIENLKISHAIMLNSDGSINSLAANKTENTQSWWQKNKSWALPSLILVSGYAAYQLRDQNMSIEWP